MRYIIPLVLLLLFPGRALAAGPEAPLDYTIAQTGTYQFQIIDYSSAQTEQLNVDFTAPSFINWTGSIGLTLISLVSDNILLSSLTILIIITMAMVFMFSVLANSKIDANISDLTTDIELNQSLEQLASDPDSVADLRQKRDGLNRQISKWQNRRVSAGRAYGDFRQLNRGRRR